MSSEIIVIPAKELQEMICLAVRSELASITPKEQPAPAEYLTRKQTAAKLQVSLVTLHEWTKSGILQGYRISGMVRYKLAELEVALQAMQKQKKQGNNREVTGEIHGF